MKSRPETPHRHKGRGVAEHRTQIVVVGNAAAHQHQRRGGERVRQPVQRNVTHPAAERQNAAMQVKTDNAIQHRRFRHIDRHIGRKIGKDIRDAGKPVLEDENAFRRKGTTRLVGGGQHAQHNRAFRDETALATGEITLANIAKGGNARIGRVFDRDQSPTVQERLRARRINILTGHRPSHRRETGRPRR